MCVKDPACPVNCAPAANPAAGPVYADAPDALSTPMGQLIAGNALNNADVPAGQQATVMSFTVAGSSQVYTPGSSPITMYSPTTGQPIGTLTMAASGAYTFDPVDGFIGPVPAINVYSQTSDGLKTVGGLTIDVVAREYGHALACWRKYPPLKGKYANPRLA